MLKKKFNTLKKIFVFIDFIALQKRYYCAAACEKLYIS
tara:strand:+ start:1069 stop:1182 length:114 start_codon:yes stop_codon:yes gene_type:complete